MQLDRRTFFLTSGGALFAQASPSKQITVGVIGSGGRGRYLESVFKRDPGVRIVAVCDVYEPNLEAGLSAAGNQAKAYRNYKALLDDKAIDAVIIATPEHWHHRMLLDVLAAGKDVYVEKPLCQTPEQGAELVRAAAHSKSVVQVGMQRRSYELFHKARDIKKSGTLGNVRMVRSWWLNNNLRGSSQTPVLKGPLDWEQWQGPASKRTLDADRFFDWRSYSEYSGGIVADQGAHVYDGIHLVMDSGFPVAVNASAGRVHKSKVDTPESVVVAAEYAEDFVAVFTINYAAMRYQNRNDQLSHFDGDQARMDLGREKLAVYKEEAEDEPVLTAAGSFAKAAEEHVANFLQCVRTRATPNATVEKAFQAALVVQLANMSLRQGRRIKWNAALQRVES
ncbi:MAG: oxidoreductase domain protein [Bryobacterales bacterium]|nr:oxidoreductase domain protein [Bryobacterales bacterium]